MSAPAPASAPASEPATGEALFMLRRNGSEFMENSKLPKLSDPGKKFKLIINSAKITDCTKSKLEFGITDYLANYIATSKYDTTDKLIKPSTVNKNRNEFSDELWKHLEPYFSCAHPTTTMGLTIDWTFNNKTKQASFKLGENIDFTMATDCAGSYGPCNDNVKTWDLLLSPYPYDRPCQVKRLLPCVSKSPKRSPRVATTPSSDPDPDPDPDPDKEPDPEPETPWYEKPLYIGLIAAGVVVLVLVIVFSMGKSPPPSPSNSLNKLPT